MITDNSRAFARSRWFMLAICLFLGGVSVLVSEIARGHSGSPYDWLGAVGGVAYALAVALQRWRG
jgi:hypothetical protein